MASIANRLPAGMRDFLPRSARRRRHATATLMEEFRLHGYLPVSAPLFEHADVLDRGLGETTKQDVLRFVGTGGDVVALRPDITPQIARIASQRFDRDAVLRFCYEGLVARRADTSGRLQQQQVGVELLGVAAESGDAEILALATLALQSLGLSDYVLEIGHTAVAAYVLGRSGRARDALRSLLEKKDNAGVLALAAKLPKATRTLVAQLLGLQGAPAQVFARVGEMKLPRPIVQQLDRFRTALTAIASGSAVSMDLTQVRGLGYYSGLRFVCHAHGASGEIMHGGRYDDLAAQFGSPIASAGFAVSIDRLLEARAFSGALGARVVAVVAAAKDTHAAQKQCSSLRKRGHGAALFVGDAQLAPRLFAQGYDQVMYIEAGQWYSLADEGTAPTRTKTKG